MGARRDRTRIPDWMAARVLFLSDRTCCVCRTRGKGVQIHHVDENPANNSLDNLAVLCMDCHTATQIRGGFARRLDAEQVKLYRNDWHRLVAEQRASSTARTDQDTDLEERLEMMTSIAEIFRENGEYSLLASHYASIGNSELRDKYVELSLEQEQDDDSVWHLRALQKRPDLVPPEVVERLLQRMEETEDWTQRARLLAFLGRHLEAAKDYIKGIASSLDDDNPFSAAFYLKELEQLVAELYLEALKQATEENDLWWQVRALEELEWHDELKRRLIRHEAAIEAGDDPRLQALLAWARGDSTAYIEARKDEARREASGPGFIYLRRKEEPGEPEGRE